MMMVMLVMMMTMMMPMLLTAVVITAVIASSIVIFCSYESYSQTQKSEPQTQKIPQPRALSSSRPEALEPRAWRS